MDAYLVAVLDNLVEFVLFVHLPKSASDRCSITSIDKSFRKVLEAHGKPGVELQPCRVEVGGRTGWGAAVLRAEETWLVGSARRPGRPHSVWTGAGRAATAAVAGVG